MKPGESKPAGALFVADALLRSLGVQLKDASRDLQTTREKIRKTKETIQETREAIARTDALIQTDGLLPTESRHLSLSEGDRQ